MNGHRSETLKNLEGTTNTALTSTRYLTLLDSDVTVRHRLSPPKECS